MGRASRARRGKPQRPHTLRDPQGMRRDETPEIRQLCDTYDSPRVRELTQALLDEIVRRSDPEADDQAGYLAFLAICRLMAHYAQSWLQAPPDDGVADPWGDVEVMMDLLDLLVLGPLEVCAEEMVPFMPSDRASKAH